MKRTIEWLALILIISFFSSALFHSCKYHSHYDDDNMIKIAYRGIEQFWHKHDKEYRMSLKDLMEYQKSIPDKIYAEMEGRGFVESENKMEDEDHGYHKWAYKSQNPLLVKYEMGYGEMGDTSVVIYTVSENEYFNDLKNQITNLGFTDSSYTVKLGILHVYNNRNLGLEIIGAESLAPGGKPSQLIIAKETEMKAVLQKTR